MLADMPLKTKSPSAHNQLLGQKIRHPPSTNWDDDDEFPTPSSKRQKRKDAASKSTASDDEETTSPKRSPVRTRRTEIPDSEDEDEGGGAALGSQTALETSLPDIKTDEEAIEAYEAYKAGEQTLEDRLDNRSWEKGRSSIYVDAFNLALDTVLEEEGHLFDEAELSLFQQWRDLTYESQYLYVRLFLRKTSAWHRINKLGYYSDIADLDAAVVDLQKERTLPETFHPVQNNPGELEPPEGTTLSTSFRFAECSSDHITTLDEASSLLLLDELKALAKEAKINSTSSKTKRELLAALRNTSGKQTGLGFQTLLKRSDTENSVKSEAASTDNDSDSAADGTHTPSSLPFTKPNRDAHFTTKILSQVTGKCIRLSLAPLKLFERVHLVFYRSTEWTEKSLTTLILAKISRRNFPAYVPSRSATIFASRALLLEFEAALRVQFRVDSILEFNGTPGRRQFEEVLGIFEDVYPRWKVLVEEERGREERVYESGEGAYLRRFSPAWVYTRIVCKGLLPLGRFKEHGREHWVLGELLGQRLFHGARRGGWYQRKALLEEHYVWAVGKEEEGGGETEEVRRKKWRRVALRTCEEGLQDRECHLIYHYDLQKRVRKLERALKLPKREQHDFGHALLVKAVERRVEGVRVEKREVPLLRRGSSDGGEKKDSVGAVDGSRRGAKTIWIDELDTQAHVGVESMCLSWYRSQGWKGYHSEGGILRTLFGLLFYDILFMYLPNVFQTSVQIAPLDLHTDAFYGARISEINQRVREIGAGEAGRLVKEVWEREYERRTCVVGVRWDEYALEDLLEIVGCFRGEALGTVMLTMAQEYQARGGGVPDLFLWKPARSGEDGDSDDATVAGEVMFAEVKSQNDRLSQTQELWIHVLMGAGIRTELCHAVAREVRAE